MPTRRQERVSHLLREEISRIIRFELHDPDIGFTTITAVEVSADLQHARVYTSVMGEESEVRQTLTALDHARRHIRSELADRLDLKHTPDLSFELDEIPQHAQQMESLLAQITHEDEQRASKAHPEALCTTAPAPQHTLVIGQIAELLSVGHQTVILTHQDPDGDAIGSSLALALALDQLGQSAHLACATPVPQRYDFLPEVGRFITSVPEAIEVAVLVDTADYSQLGALAGAVEQAATVVLIDHHNTNAGGADIDYLDSSAAAAALQVYHVIKALGVSLDWRIATCLYYGLAADTGFFTFENSSAHALQIAGELAAAGADPYHIATEIRGRLTLPAAILRGRALAHLRTAADGRIVYATLTPADFAAAGIDRGNAEGIIDLLKSVAGAQVVMLFKAVSHRHWRVSLRSADIDVATIAQQFGGGGHTAAAGCELEGPLPSARMRILRAVREALAKEL